MRVRHKNNNTKSNHSHRFAVIGLISFVVPMVTHADQVAAPNQEQDAPVSEAEFDSAFLIGDARKVDIERFRYGNPVMPGMYNADVYVNENWFGKRSIEFKSLDGKKAYTCFSVEQLLEMGVRKALLENLAAAQNECILIHEQLEGAFYHFDNSQLRLDISIPQSLMQKYAQGYVDPSLWDRGIQAGFLSYSASAYKNFNDSANGQERSNAFVSLNGGLNLLGWQFRHNGQWRWTDRNLNNEEESSYESTSSYLQRAFPDYRGVLTLGDSYTSGEIFDSFGYRGVDFSSDDRMLPSSMLGYAPRIRGNAKTNAKVEVRQQGQLIYQTTVAPGSFEINDLYPTGFGGELEVSVIEATGEIQRFAIPYSSVVQMLRPGMSRYALTLGQFRDRQITLDPMIGQFKYQRGINNYITGFGGAQLSAHYNAFTLGSAFATPIGAVALDVTHSIADMPRGKQETGQSYRLSYSKLFTPTSTNLTLAAYRYSTENFYKLRDAILTQDLIERGISSNFVGKQRSEFQITLNQGLPDKYGNFYLTGSWIDYWNRNESTRQYQVGYSNHYGGLTYGLSAIHRTLEDTITGRSNNDTEYMLTLSLPMTFKKSSVNFNSTTTQDNINVGLSGAVGDRLNYGASMSNQYGNNPSLNVNGQYRTNFTSLGASYSIADRYQQASISSRGNIVAHAGGVHFGPDQGQTMVLVYAPDAAGAKVNNAVGLSINQAGYAVIPYVTPYRLNDISLDPVGMSDEVELEQTSHRIAPFAGAITKVDFSTKSGKAIYLKGTRANGELLPFGAEIYDRQNGYVGMVGQGSLVYLRTHQLADTVTVKWGSAAEDSCQITYQLNEQDLANSASAAMEEVKCQ